MNIYLIFPVDERGQQNHFKTSKCSIFNIANQSFSAVAAPANMNMMLNMNSSTEWRSVMQELTLHKDEVERLREELEEVKLQFKNEQEVFRDQVNKVMNKLFSVVKMSNSWVLVICIELTFEHYSGVR